MKTFILCMVCLPAFALAQPSDGEGRRKGRRGPPAEAVTACEGASAGDACRFEGRRGEMAGTCFAPDDKPLACRPERNRRRRGPRDEE